MGMDNTLLTSDVTVNSPYPDAMDTGNASIASYIPLNPVDAYSSPSSSFTRKPGMFNAGNMALFMSVAGAANSAIGSYYAAQSQQYQMKSQAVNLQYQSDMAAINARQSEYQAESDIKAGQSQTFNYTMQAGQQKASATANMASRGLRAGIGTTQDVAASMDIVKDINVYNINSNAVREASAARVQSTNYQNQSNLDSVSAANANRSAGSISPFAAMSSSLLTSAGSIANQWNNTQRMKMYLANGGYMPGAMGGFN